MPLHKYTEKLGDLCVASIADNMDNLWCADFREKFANHKLKFVIGPFHYLDTICLKKILQAMHARRKLKKLHLHLLITPFLVELDLSMAPKHVTNELIDITIERCDHLNSVNLDSCNRISSRKIVELVKKFGASLTNLDISHTKMDGKVMESIGLYCKKLLVLNISHTNGLAASKVRKLFRTDKSTEEQQCTDVSKTLKVLHMTWFNSPGEDEVPLLKNILSDWCPKITTLGHAELWKAVIQICEETNYTHMFALTGLVYEFPIPMTDLKGSVDFSKVMACLPQFKHLSMQYMSHPMDIEMFDIVSVRGSCLMSLNVDWNAPFSYIEYIGKECPNLVTMQLSMHCVDETVVNVRDSFEAFQANRVLNHSPWSKLEIMSLHFGFGNNNVCSSDISVLKQIFAGSRKTLIEARINAMPHPGINQLLQEALEHGHLESLEHLDVSDSKCVSSETLWDLVLREGNLSKITFMECQDIHCSHFIQLHNYVTDNNLNVKLIYDVNCMSDVEDCI